MPPLKRNLPVPVLLAAWLFLFGASEVALAGPVTSVAVDLETAENDAQAWLLRQMVPNDVVPAPDPERRRLLLSYRVPLQDPAYPYVSGRSFIYDDALAAIALTMRGSYREAEFILNALRSLLRPDGSLWFAYNTQNSWPGETDREGAIIRTGALAWVGYAFTYYLEVRMRDDSGFPATDPLGAQYGRAARSIASFLLASQVANLSDPRHGLITGGAGASTVVLDSASRPGEVYSPDRVRWVSMEHNIDAWFFLRDLARLTGDAGLARAAELVRTRVDSLWSAKDGQFQQGIHGDGSPDSALPLDGASWGALFLSAQGRDAQARQCASVMQARYGAQVEGLRGFRPYGAAPVYTDERVNRFFFPDDPGREWKDLPFVWGEGSLGAAAALIRTGERQEGEKILDSLRALAVDGGLRYASAPLPYQFMDYPSVASTSWFIITVEMLRGGPAAGSFWGP